MGEVNHMPTYHPFLERLRQGPIVGDGGMGTQLYARGISYERCFEQLNLTEPEVVKTIHLEYAAAGTEIIETNTFGANRFRLAEHGLERSVRELNRARVSAQQAEKFHHEVPGIVIPEEVRTRLRRAGEAATLVGVEMIKEVFDALYSSVQGAYIMTLGRYDLVGELLPHIRLRAQAKKLRGRA